MSILYHFSKNPFILNLSFDYRSVLENMKPHGLWLSNESNGLGWSDWCKGEEFKVDHLQYQTKFYVEHKKCICLTSYEDIYQFTKEYKIDFSKHFGSPLITQINMIDWEKVKEKYSGIIITPYCWKSRLDFLWYYGWDCESGCIWDTSILKLG